MSSTTLRNLAIARERAARLGAINEVYISLMDGPAYGVFCRCWPGGGWRDSYARLVICDAEMASEIGRAIAEEHGAKFEGTVRNE